MLTGRFNTEPVLNASHFVLFIVFHWLVRSRKIGRVLNSVRRGGGEDGENGGLEAIKTLNGKLAADVFLLPATGTTL